MRQTGLAQVRQGPMVGRAQAHPTGARWSLIATHARDRSGRARRGGSGRRTRVRWRGRRWPSRWRCPPLFEVPCPLRRAGRRSESFLPRLSAHPGARQVV